MAEFNPFIPPSNIPDWTNAPGRLVDQSGFGELFANLATTGAKLYGAEKDKQKTNDIDSSMRGMWDTARLEEDAAKAGINPEIAKGMNRIELLNKAIAKGGVSHTSAYAQMEVEMKRLTAKYPDRADEIQQAYAKATGNTPANDIYKEAEANYATATKAEQDAKDDVTRQFNTWAPYMDSEDIPGFQTADAATQNKAVVKAAARKNQNESIDVMKNQLALKKANNEANVDAAAPGFVQDIDNGIGNVFRGDMNKVIDAIKKANEDGNMDPNEKQEILKQIEQSKMVLTKMFDERLSTPFGPPGQQTTWNQIFVKDPGIIETQQKRIAGYISMMDSLVENKSGMGIAQATATTMKMQQEHAQSEFAKTSLGQQAVKFDAITKVYGEAGKTWMEENFTTIMDSTKEGQATLATAIAQTLQVESMTPGSTLAGATEAARGKVAKGEEKAFNTGARAAIESSFKTITDPNTDEAVWNQHVAWLYSPENERWFAALSPVENSQGVSQQELAFQKFTSPAVEKAFKDRGQAKVYYDTIVSWKNAVWGSLPEDIRGAPGIVSGTGIIGSKASTASFNPDTMQTEFRIDPSKVKDMGALREFITDQWGGKVSLGKTREKTGLSIDELNAIKALAKNTQRANLIMKAEVGALRAQGMSDDKILTILQQELGDLNIDKQSPFLENLIPMIGQYAKDVVTGKVAKDNYKAKRKAMYGEDFGVNPDGSGVALSTVAEPATTSSTGTQPNTGDGTADSILGLIHGAEGADYNTVFGGGKVDAAGMTVADVLARTENAGSSAFGAVQVMKKTLQGLVKNGVVTPDQKMTQETQDKIGLALMKEAGYDDWKSGKLSDGKFADKLAGIWASLPDKSGKSVYASDGVNKARVERRDVLALLDQLR